MVIGKQNRPAGFIAMELDFHPVRAVHKMILSHGDERGSIARRPEQAQFSGIRDQSKPCIGLIKVRPELKRTRAIAQFGSTGRRFRHLKWLVWQTERQSGDIIADGGGRRRINIAEYHYSGLSARKIKNEGREAWSSAVHVIRGFTELLVGLLEPAITNLRRRIENCCA